MTNEEIYDVRNLYKEYLNLYKKIIKLKEEALRVKTGTQLNLIPYEDIEKIEILTKEAALRKLYTDKAKNSKNSFNIKVYMGSYYYYVGPDSDDFTNINDLLTFENDPRAAYRVFCDIEKIYNNRFESGEDIIPYSNKEKFEKYEEENTIIVVPNKDMKKSIIEASQYSDYERFRGIDRYFGLSGKMDESIKFNRKGDVDSFGDLYTAQNYFFGLLMKMNSEEAVTKLTKKYKPYRDFYNYNCLEKNN